jgi:hypothetical protein
MMILLLLIPAKSTELYLYRFVMETEHFNSTSDYAAMKRTTK